jgi:ABC-2 type transport system permease protein
MTVQAPPAAPHAGLARTGRAGAGLAGTGTLTRLAFRRDRIMLPAWVYLITVLVAATAYSLKKLYPTAAARAQLGVTAGANPALRFLYGRLNGSSLGALTTWRYGIWAAIFGALMTIFIVIRHTRGDEEAGRLELVGSAAVGRQAALTAGLLAAVTANLAISVLLGIALPFSGLTVSGALALALAIGASGLAFTGIAAVAAQLASRARGARGMAFGVLGAAYALRAIGDSAGPGGPSWLSWASPLGWVELTRPFDGPRWWVLALPLAVLAAGVGAAYALAARRDHGAGVLPDRPGRPAASRWLRGPFGLAWRLQRGVLGGWVAGVVCVFAASGAAAQGIGSLVGGSVQLRQEVTRLGGQAAITSAYLAALMLLAGLGAAGYATSAVLRLRAEETAGLAEPLLATAVGRVRWGLSHLAIAVFGSAVLLAVAGLAAGLGYGVRIGAAGPQAARMLGAALAQLPASLVVAGVAVVLVGLLPRVSVVGAWTVLGAVVVIDLFGEALQLSHWILDISPFTHAPRLPGGTVSAAPLLWLCLAAVAFSAVGLAALRRRDVG